MTSISKDLPPIPPPEGTYTPYSYTAEPEPAPKQPGPGLFKRLTTKLRSPSASGPAVTGIPSSSSTPAQSHQRRKTAPHTHPATAPLENAWTSPEQRRAALRARGLLPSQAQPLRDAHGYRLPLSEQEEQLDRRAVTMPAPAPRQSDDAERESEAEKIAEAWMRKNMGAAYRARSRSRERDGEQGSSDGPRTKSEAQPAPPPPAKSPVARPSHSQSPSQAFLQRDPQAGKLLDAMKNYRPPPARATTARYAASDSTDSDSD